MPIKLSNLTNLIKKLPSAVNKAIEAVGQAGLTIAKEEAPGKLGETVRFRRKGLIGLEFYSTAPYAKFVEKGRPGFSAKNAKALKFVINGQVFFRTSVGPAKANPFMARSARRLNGIALQVFKNTLKANL